MELERKSTNRNLREDHPDIIRAALQSDLEGIKLALADDPECINAKHSFTQGTALHISASLGNYSIVDFLCDQPGVETWVYDVNGHPAAWVAMLRGRKDIRDRIMKEIDREIEETFSDDVVETNVIPLNPGPT